MTLIDERPPDELDARTEATSGPQLPAAGDEEVLAPPALRDVLRPALAGGLSSAAAGITLGGVFGSWSARGLGIAAAALGAATVVIALRSTRTSQIQWAYPLLLIAVSVASVAPSPKYGAGGLLRAMRDAIDAGRVLRPPVPFDPGWRPIVIIIIGLLSFGAAWVGAALDRPRLAVALPLPIVALTAITQPEDGQVLTGVSAFVLVLAALAVLFRGDSSVTDELSGQFELKRALRSAAATVPILVLLVALSQTSFLFPKPTYNPGNTAQKPRVVPLSASHDRVLFEVKTKASFTGPWRTGVLDVYSDGSWKLPPLRIDRLRQLASDGSLGTPRGDAAKNLVTVTVRDLGNSAVLPLLGGTARVELPAGSPFRLDKRTELLRLPSGRPQPGLSYTMHVPDYPSNADLARATPGGGKDLADQLAVPSPPPFVQKLLAQAPPQPWKRLDFLRTRLYDVVTAQGGGVPVDVPPSKVDDLLDGSKKGSPYEIVAAEALLARWSGLPSRIAYGFDGLNREKTLRTVRPRNSAQWLEVNFDGYGWVPLVGTPKFAAATLDSNPDDRFKPSVQASHDLAVEVFIPYEIKSIRQQYQQIRYFLLQISPVVGVLVLGRLLWPAAMKARRRAKRRKWAAAHGPRAAVAFEYAEFRDLATDLNVGDPYLAPLEYLFHVRPDDEHNEFSWLVARVLYGDLRGVAGAAEAQAAEELGASLRRRLLRGQPVTSRLLAFLSRASLEQPYSTELPNVRSYHPLRHLKAQVRAHLHLPRRRTLRRLQPWSVR